MFNRTVVLKSIKNGDTNNTTITFHEDKMVIMQNMLQSVRSKHTGEQLSRLSPTEVCIAKFNKNNKLQFYTSVVHNRKRTWRNVTYQPVFCSWQRRSYSLLLDWLVYQAEKRGLPRMKSINPNKCNLPLYINYGIAYKGPLISTTLNLVRRLERCKSLASKAKAVTGHKSKWARRTVANLLSLNDEQGGRMLALLHLVRGLQIDSMRKFYQACFDEYPEIPIHEQREFVQFPAEVIAQVLLLSISEPRRFLIYDAARMCATFPIEEDRPKWIGKFCRVKGHSALNDLHDDLARQWRRAAEAAEAAIEIPVPSHMVDAENTVIDDLRLVFPRKGKDLLHWGDALRNCIGSYVDLAANNKTWLAALVDDNNKPKYCIEYDKDGFRQFVGFANSYTPTSIVDQWDSVFFGRQ